MFWGGPSDPYTTFLPSAGLVRNDVASGEVIPDNYSISLVKMCALYRLTQFTYRPDMKQLYALRPPVKHVSFANCLGRMDDFASADWPRLRYRCGWDRWKTVAERSGDKTQPSTRIARCVRQTEKQLCFRIPSRPDCRPSQRLVSDSVSGLRRTHACQNNSFCSQNFSHIFMPSVWHWTKTSPFRRVFF